MQPRTGASQHSSPGCPSALTSSGTLRRMSLRTCKGRVRDEKGSCADEDEASLGGDARDARARRAGAMRGRLPAVMRAGSMDTGSQLQQESVDTQQPPVVLDAANVKGHLADWVQMDTTSREIRTHFEAFLHSCAPHARRRGVSELPRARGGPCRWATQLQRASLRVGTLRRGATRHGTCTASASATWWRRTGRRWTWTLCSCRGTRRPSQSGLWTRRFRCSPSSTTPPRAPCRATSPSTSTTCTARSSCA
jgi:hypothetical protein